MEVRFLRVAAAELRQGVVYYNGESEGLGFEFLAEVQRTLTRVVTHPTAWAPLSLRTRRCRTNRFPYGVIYQVRKETILVIAVMHLNRDPECWKNRLPEQRGGKENI